MYQYLKDLASTCAEQHELVAAGGRLVAQGERFEVLHTPAEGAARGRDQLPKQWEAFEISHFAGPQDHHPTQGSCAAAGQKGPGQGGRPAKLRVVAQPRKEWA